MVDDASSTREAVRGSSGAEEAASERAASRVSDGVAARRIVERARDVVQEQPWMAVAGAFVVGYLAAQLVKRMD